MSSALATPMPGQEVSSTGAGTASWAVGCRHRTRPTRGSAARGNDVSSRFTHPRRRPETVRPASPGIGTRRPYVSDDRYTRTVTIVEPIALVPSLKSTTPRYRPGMRPAQPALTVADTDVVTDWVAGDVVSAVAVVPFGTTNACSFTVCEVAPPASANCTT